MTKSDSKTASKKVSKKQTEVVEEWGPVVLEFIKGSYEVSNLGRIRNAKTKRVLKPIEADGYLKFNYPTVEGKEKKKKIHILGALRFCPNDSPDTKTQVNHINGIKDDNRACNLEWVTPSENVQHAADTGLTKKTKSPVIQYDLETEKEIVRFESVIEASEKTGISVGQLSSACTGNTKQGTHNAHGFGWKYVNENPNRQKEEIDLSQFKQIEGFPNYFVNREGKIYSKSRKIFMKPYKAAEGAVGLQFNNNTAKKSFLVHNIVGTYFLKRTDDKNNCIRHKDGDKTNNHVDNLYWCTVAGDFNQESKFHVKCYNPKTAAVQPKRKLKKDGPKDLRTAKRNGLSPGQRVEQDKLLGKTKKTKKIDDEAMDNDMEVMNEVTKKETKKESKNKSGSKTAKKTIKKKPSKKQIEEEI